MLSQILVEPVYETVKVSTMYGARVVSHYPFIFEFGNSHDIPASMCVVVAVRTLKKTVPTPARYSALRMHVMQTPFAVTGQLPSVGERK